MNGTAAVEAIHRLDLTRSIDSRKTVLYTRMPSPIGELTLFGDGTALSALHMGPIGSGSPDQGIIREGWIRDDYALRETRRQLEAWFDGSLTEFDLPLAMRGTPFQLRVWQALRTIPYGEKVSYGEVALRIGNPTAVRAVGAANGRNPIAIIVPCHRVIGANGSLTGYGGGIERKKWLLAHEERVRGKTSRA